MILNNLNFGNLYHSPSSTLGCIHKSLYHSPPNLLLPSTSCTLLDKMSNLLVRVLSECSFVRILAQVGHGYTSSFHIYGIEVFIYKCM